MATPNPQFEFEAIITAIKSSKEWRILVYGVNEPNKEEQNNLHFSILKGILGFDITNEKKTLPKFSFVMNTVTVTVHIGSHPDCNVNHEDIDLLLIFTALEEDAVKADRVKEAFENITATRGAEVWKNSVAVISGVAQIFGKAENKKNPQIRLETLEKSWTTAIQMPLKSLLEDNQDVEANELLVVLAGNAREADLPTPHEKWLSKLVNGCILSSKVNAIPATLKLIQGRLSNSVSNDVQGKPLHQQPIQVKRNSIDLPAAWKAGFGIGGGGTIVAAGVAGATVGALIGALAIGIPSFGVAAGTGLVLGAAIGGGLGMGVAGAAVGGGIKARMDKERKKLDDEQERRVDIADPGELKLFYAYCLSEIPTTSKQIKTSALKAASCNIAVSGIEGDRISTCSAALIGKQPDARSQYFHQIIPMKYNLNIFLFKELPRVEHRQDQATELVKFMQGGITRPCKHMLVFAIPMTSNKRLWSEFKHSAYAKYLEHLFQAQRGLHNNLVIALTHANEMRATKREQNIDGTLQDYFYIVLEEWKQVIQKLLLHKIDLKEDDVNKVTILPVGNHEPSIDLSEDEQPAPATQYHWYAQFLLKAIPSCKIEGLPSLTQACVQRLRNFPQEYSEDNRAQVIEAKCLLFSKFGFKVKNCLGEAIGHILGVKDKQNWD